MTITNARGRHIVLSGWSGAQNVPAPAPSCALPPAPDASSIAASLDSILPGLVNASRGSLAAAASLPMPHLLSLASDSAQFIGPAGPFGSLSSSSTSSSSAAAAAASSSAPGASATADGDAADGDDGGTVPPGVSNGPVNYMNITNETTQLLMLQADDGLRCLLCAPGARGKAYKYIGKARRHLEIAHFYSEESATQSTAAAAAIGVTIPPSGCSPFSAQASSSSTAGGSGGADAAEGDSGRAGSRSAGPTPKRAKPAHVPGISARGAAVLAADPDRKRFVCPFPDCAKEYLSRQSLAAHKRIKHAGAVPPGHAGAAGGDGDGAGDGAGDGEGGDEE